MSMCNRMLPRFPDNYKRERDSDERENNIRLWREWKFRMIESNTLHDDLIWLEAPFVDRILLTLSRWNMHQYKRAMAKIKKENNRMILCRCKYLMLQLTEELAVATNRQLTLAECNNVLNYEDYLLEWMTLWCVYYVYGLS